MASSKGNEVTEKDLQDLSGELRDEWIDLARKLNIPEGKIYAKKTNNRDNEKETIFQTLLSWKQSEGQDAMYDVLAKALSDVGRKDLADKLQTDNNREFTPIPSHPWQPPGRSMDVTVPDEVLRKLYRKVGNDWRNIGISLKLEEYDLDHISSNNVGNQAEMSRQMFRKWKQKNGQNATYRKLEDALKAEERTDLVDELKLYKKQLE